MGWRFNCGNPPGAELLICAPCNAMQQNATKTHHFEVLPTMHASKCIILHHFFNFFALLNRDSKTFDRAPDGERTRE